MKITLSPAPASAVEADVLAVFVFQLEKDEAPDSRVDAWTGGLLGDLYSRGELRGRLFDSVTLHRPNSGKAGRLLLIGAGKRADLDGAKIRRAAAFAARELKGKQVKRLAFDIENLGQPETAVQAVVEGMLLGHYEPDAYKAERTTGVVEELILSAPVEAGGVAARGEAIAESQNFARTLVNEPGNRLPPREFASRARAMADEVGLDIRVLERPQLELLGMGALLGVAAGSVEPPVLMTVSYRPEVMPESGVHLGLVGKGVTFDTGGISIKPAADMGRMKYDMAGGAGVLGAIRALAKLKPAVPVTAVIPSVENMPGGAAFRPGDVLTSFSGKTIEVLNTDAEGRLILADALSWAQRQGCNRLIDAATLTGSIVIALGNDRIGLFTNDNDWQTRVLASSEAAGERMWAMPMDEEYRRQLDSPIADLQNIGTRSGGSITAAMFLKEFADPAPWAHLDIAGTAWAESAQPDMPKGPTGVGVRTFVELALGLQ